MKMRGFKELVHDVKLFEHRLASPPTFYNHRKEYHQAARKVAENVLRLSRPVDTDAQEWDRKVERILERVISELLIGGNGIIFGVTDPGELKEGGLAPKATRSSSQTMTYDNIKDWIRAGIRGVPGGKRITAIDDAVMQKKGIDGVAQVVMKAYYSSKADARYNRLRAAIQRYFLGGKSKETAPLLDAVAKAWIEHFTPVIRRDLSDYADRICREF